MFPEHTYRWIDAAAPTHPSLIDTRHVDRRVVRLRQHPDGGVDRRGRHDRAQRRVGVDRAQPAARHRDPRPTSRPGWRRRSPRSRRSPTIRPSTARRSSTGSSSAPRRGSRSRPTRWSPDRSPRGADQARATACFELGQHLERTGDREAARAWWRQAHDLDRSNWTYKRQAWTLETTPEGADANDLTQEAGAVYGTSWIDDVLALGGGARYVVEPDL